MKTDLTTSIITALIGTVAAYFACTLFIPPISKVEFQILDPASGINYNLTEPNAEVFNYRAVNPTVEVIINGDCTDGDCDSNSVENEEETEEEEEPVEEPESEGENTNGTTD
jgi:hypothetical protein